MGKYGLKIKNYQAASIYDYQNGFRSQTDNTDAMLVNSLFLDYLYTLPDFNVYKEKSTRDIICLEFGYGTKGYSESINKIDKNIEKAKSEETKRELLKLKANIENNAEKCIKIDRKKLREMAYVDGIELTYKAYNRKGEIINEETIKYRMLYRTPGKAKKGTCMFVNEKLYERVHNFLYMGITLPEHNAPIVEIGAYSSLITSSIVGKVQIKPEEMLIIKDVKTSLLADAIKVATDESKHCYAEKVSNYKLTGEAFDGQALIDSSIFPKWADGFILLRHHFTKCAAFNTNIELFMRDYFGDSYDTATVTDMFGREVKVKNVKLITTDNAIKWLKFDGITFDYWSDWVRKNDCMFGIVKTTHESKLGSVQRMSYQMINSLDINSMSEVSKTSVEYVKKLKTDDYAFLDYLKDNVNFSNDFDVLVALCEHNPDFIYSEYFRDRRTNIIQAYVLNLKSGRVIQNADNLTIVGSPYAMLLHSVGEDPRSDPTFRIRTDCIECWTERFDDNTYLAEFRNPFNSRNNLGYVHNVHHEFFDKYFKLGKLCIAVNTLDTDWQNRNNGADQDSDSCYTTDQKDIVAHAKYCYENYPTIVNEIKPEKNIYDYSLKNYAKIDNELTSAQLAIGESSNVAQLCLTYTYNFEDQKYYDNVCILAVLAQCAIDNAKRKYDVELDKEIPRIKELVNVVGNGVPKFWQITKKDKRKANSEEERKQRIKENKEKIKEKLNPNLICPMNYLYDLQFDRIRTCNRIYPNEDFMILDLTNNDRRKSKKVEELIEKYSLELYINRLNTEHVNWNEDNPDLILCENFDELINDIRQINISGNYKGLMSWLINRAFCIGAGAKRNESNMDSNTDKNKSLLLKVLYTINPKVFLSCFKEKVYT